MEQPLKLTFHGVEPTPAIEARIHDRVAKLEKMHDGIVACHVTVAAPHRHHHKGTLFNVRIDLTVKHGEIFVGRDPSHDHSHEDLYVAIRDAFDAARRLLQDHVCKQRGDVKVSQHAPHARVARLFAEDGYGFLETADGREIYFHRNSVLDDRFDRLTVGSAVRFAEEQGAKGPQASTVTPL